jgi:hypothetical protein
MTQTFLAECLGGRFEPMTGDRIAGSTAVVKTIRKQERQAGPRAASS